MNRVLIVYIVVEKGVDIFGRKKLYSSNPQICNQKNMGELYNNDGFFNEKTWILRVNMLF